MRSTHIRTELAQAYVGLGAALAAVIIAGSAAPAATAERAIPPVTSCDALAKSDLTRQDAQITSTATATRDGHAYCDVKGFISPMTQFEALLPMETWRGNNLQQGCGGFCGHVDVDCTTHPGPAAIKRPTPFWRTARWWLRQTTRATKRPATAMRCGQRPTRNCGWFSGTSPSTSLRKRPKP